MPQCLVAFQPAPRPDQQLESVIETIAYFGCGHRSHPGRGQLNRQWNPVEPTTNLLHRMPTQSADKLSARSANSFTAATTSSEDTRHSRSSARAESFAARRENLARWLTAQVRIRSVPQLRRRRAHNCRTHRSRTRPSNADATDSVTLLPGCWVMPRAGGDRVRHRRRIRHRSELENPYPVRKFMRKLRRDFQCQPRLADATDTGQCDQPTRPNRGRDIRDLYLTPDATGHRRPQVARIRIERPQWRKVCPQARSLHLVDRNRICDVA